MTPQPLSRVLRTATIIRLPANALSSRPHLALKVAELVGINSLSDFKWSEVLVALLKADPRTGVAMYQALISAEAKRAALLAAAKASLNADDALLLHACIKSTNGSRKTRNRLAHHVWCVSDDLPEALLLCAPEYLVRVGVDALDAVRRADLEGGKVRLEPLDFSKFDVWTTRDFDIAIADAISAFETVKEVETGLYFFGPGFCSDTTSLLLRRPLVAQAHQHLQKNGAG